MKADNLGQPTSNSSATEQVKPSFIDRLKRLFSGPHLSYAPIVFIVWLILTEAGLSLINQPVDYWFDHSRASGDILIKTLLKAGPIVHIGVYLVYAILISLAL